MDTKRLKVFYDHEGKTLTVWFDDPSKEHVCQETGDEVVLMKDAEGHVIGFERLNISVETASEGLALDAKRI